MFTRRDEIARRFVEAALPSIEPNGGDLSAGAGVCKDSTLSNEVISGELVVDIMRGVLARDVFR